MRYLVIDNAQLIIFWSAKCGCTTLQTILSIYFNIDPQKYGCVHKNKDLTKKFNRKNDNKINIYKKYDIVMLVRNPYERIVSGFLNKYVNHSHYKNPPNCKCFYDFCKILLENPEVIDERHFRDQTSDIGWDFYKELQRPNVKYILDTSQVNDLAKILGLNLPEIKKNYTQNVIKNDEDIEKTNCSYLDYESLKNLNTINYSNFYNDDLKKIVYNIYKNDFTFLNDELKMNYTI
tara:strand:- start:6359 stop:7060 length:702 start_codon:yes stop_codon:yes gene_type:complete